MRDAYQSVPAWSEHLNTNAGLAARLGDTLGTRGMGAWESWCAYVLCFAKYSLPYDAV
jgi:hypothetical protein